MANVREIGVFLRKDVTWDTVTPFLCVLQLSRLLRVLFARFLARYGGRVPIPSIRVPFYLPLILSISQPESLQACRMSTRHDHLSVYICKQDNATSIIACTPVDKSLPTPGSLSFISHDRRVHTSCLLLIHE